MGDLTPAGGPLAGLRILEFVSIGPGPHSAMLLSDLGAEVVRIDRPGGNGWPNPIMDRGRAIVEIDIRTDKGRDLCVAAAMQADVIIEGMRPGTMERLGLGPEILCLGNERLVYGRMTGWGQIGPLAKVAGHDINYIGLTGALAAIGSSRGPSIPPLNLVGDFGGGSLYLAFGIMAALWERERSGKGQVVDAAIVDGVASMMTMFTGLTPSGAISLDKSKNMLGGAAPFYRCYTCADGRDIAVGPIEPQFYASFVALAGAPKHFYAQQNDSSNWRERSEVLESIFATKTCAQWCDIFEGTDACVTPVLTADEAPNHPQMQARKTFIDVDGQPQAAPAPRFSRTPGRVSSTRHGYDVLRGWGVEIPDGFLNE